MREFGHFPLVPDYPHTALLLVFAKQPPAAPCVLWTVPTASSVSLTASSSVSCLKPGLPWAPTSPEAPSRECCYFCHTPWTSLSLSSFPRQTAVPSRTPSSVVLPAGLLLNPSSSLTVLLSCALISEAHSYPFGPNPAAI